MYLRGYNSKCKTQKPNVRRCGYFWNLKNLLLKFWKLISREKEAI